MQAIGYSSRFGLSQSYLKDWEYLNPKAWLNKVLKSLQNKKDEKSEDHYDFGSLTDCLAFTPSLLNDRFTTVEIQFPGDGIKTIVDRIFHLHSESNSAFLAAGIPVKTPNLAEFEEQIYNISREKKWITEGGEKKLKCLYGGDNYSKERIVKEVLNKGEEYFNKRIEIGDRIPITWEDSMLAAELVEILRSHPATQVYFVQQEGETLLFQHELFVPIVDYSTDTDISTGENTVVVSRKVNKALEFFSENGIQDKVLYKKGALDIVRINHIAKTIQNVDFKTSYDAYKHNFIRSIKKYKYGTQVSYYDVLLSQWKEEHYPDYTMLPPINITIDTTLKVPFIYEYDMAELEILRYGGQTKTGYPIKGWEESLEEIRWHIENNIWDSCKEMVETGKIQVKLFE